MRSPQQRLGLTQTQRLSLNTSLQASIALLRTDAAGLTRYLEEQAAENPNLRLEPPPDPALQEWLPRWTSVLSMPHAGSELAADMVGYAPSLFAHVSEAIAALALPPHAHRIAIALADALEPSGWLGTAPESVAADLGVSLPDLITETLADYERLAIQLGRQPARLASYKRYLAEQGRASPLFKVPQLVGDIEAGFERLALAARAQQA